VDRRVDGTMSVDVLADLSRHRASTSVVNEVSRRGKAVPYHADTDESEHTTGIGSSPGLSASEVRGEVELCVLISLPRTLVERPIEIVNVKEWRDLENQVRGRSRSLKMAPFDRPYMQLSIGPPLQI